ncbi:hypothetical protein [Nakamurella panacisegetis]|uniref:hypothetical protein n=1 Tax=Nakamurella panacisegetis TaxID=1090615 RepID=UPI001E4E31F7|nr:hypothetical protein [Nakamurella panacisegetis]
MIDELRPLDDRLERGAAQEASGRPHRMVNRMERRRAGSEGLDAGTHPALAADTH